MQFKRKGLTYSFGRTCRSKWSQYEHIQKENIEVKEIAIKAIEEKNKKTLW